jgi:protoporphyrinogen oxidase
VTVPARAHDGRVCVLGAGLAGLSAARDLANAGRRVTVLEAAPTIGGLAESIEVGGTPIERFYHFLCTGDHDLLDLCDELGIGGSVHWAPGGTAFFFDGELYGFSGPFDLLRFSPVPFTQRVRFGLNVIRSRYRRSWRELDRVPARDWLIRQIGRRAYDVIWHPLLQIKFGDAHDRVSAAWIWHRIHRVARSRRSLLSGDVLGALDYGSARVVDALTRSLETHPQAELRLASPVERIEVRGGHVVGVRVAGLAEPLPCDAVLSTGALPRLLEIAPDLDPGERSRFAAIDYLGVVCTLLQLKRPLTGTFWININDDRIPFNGVIEYTALNPHPRFDGATMLYVPHYLPVDHPRFGYDDDRLRQEAVAGLRLLQPEFDESWIEDLHVSRARHAQAVCPVGFADMVPDHRTSVAGLYLTDSTQFYPEDRTLSAAVRLGRTVAGMIDRDLADRGIAPRPSS